MKKYLYHLASACLVCMLTAVSSRQTVTQDCIYKKPQQLDMLSQRWINTFIEIKNNYNGQTSVSYLQPVGYFQIDTDNSYSRYSNGDKLTGKWKIDANCRLVLDAGTKIERGFDVIKLSLDTLIIRRQDAHNVYMQHYKTVPGKSFVMVR